jgi:hypothetical protein
VLNATAFLPGARRRKARRASPEHDLQKAVAQYLAVALRPPTFWSSLDHGAGKMARASAGLRKARGVKAGLPDVLIMSPVDDTGVLVLGIELKSEKGSLSDEQRTVQAAFRACEANYKVCRSIEEVELALREVGIPYRATALVRVARYTAADAVPS